MPSWFRSKPVVPVVRLTGIIGQGTALRPGLSLAGVEGALDKAFRIKAPAVALVVNSPGGSPVQSSLIATRVRALAAKNGRTVVAFVEDVAASGGYWLAAAADEIVADANSIVGSIGVVTATFGFPELLDKLGVERRVYTVGENKAILDPFRPEREADVAILRSVQADVHDAFVAAVRERRGGRLGDDPDLFTGRFWSARSGLAIGLVDRIGEIRSVVKERYGERVQLRNIPTARPSFWRARLGIGLDPQGALSADGLIGAARSHLMWERYGL
ncbi:S49 family peptidase [Acuticoccus sp.]|uniref:S49 family peptidase n=1 Tax=Acuticoccus sp. TaxID=1904378 RepID=UPI003B52FDD6